MKVVGGVKEKMRTFGEAIKTINPKLSINGFFSDIWYFILNRIAWAKLYIEHRDFKNANLVLH